MTFAPAGERHPLLYDIRLASHIPGLAAIVHASLTRSVNKNLDKVERDA